MAARLGTVCRDAREDLDVRAIDVALTAGVSEATISRFEHGRWPRDPDRIVDAYAEECHLDALELWRRATR